MSHFHRANNETTFGYTPTKICRHTSLQYLPGLRSHIRFPLKGSFGGHLVQSRTSFKVRSDCSGTCLAEFWISLRISYSLAEQSVPVLNCYCCKYFFLMASQNFPCCSLCPFVLISAFKSLLLQNQLLHLSSVKQCSKIIPVMGLGMSTMHSLSGNPSTWHLHMRLAVFLDGFCSLCPALLPCFCQAHHVLPPYLQPLWCKAEDHGLGLSSSPVAAPQTSQAVTVAGSTPAQAGLPRSAHTLTCTETGLLLSQPFETPGAG